MIARSASAYEQQITQVFGKVKGASRGAWLAGLGAVARVQSQAPRYVSGLVKDGERFEGRALKSANEILATIKESRGYGAVQKAAKPYLGKLRKAYAGGKKTVAKAKRNVPNRNIKRAAKRARAA
jgi:poly(hydroxyalkanoate) granule-associated protein